MSAYGGVLAERFERVRLMVGLDVAAVPRDGRAGRRDAARGARRCSSSLTAAVSSTLCTVYEPAAAAMTPQLVPERDLGSANALRNTVDNVCVVAGPGHRRAAPAASPTRGWRSPSTP